MTQENPVLQRYMERFTTALKSFECAESHEIVNDLRGHIEEAQAMGKPLDAVLQSIGPADTLARAYAVELALNPRGARFQRTLFGALKVVGILAAAGVVSFLVVAGLGAIAIGLTGSGVGLIIIGALEAAGVHLPSVQLAGLSPYVVMAIGPVFIAIGLAAFAGLWIYVRALVHILLRTLPRTSGRSPR